MSYRLGSPATSSGYLFCHRDAKPEEENQELSWLYNNDGKPRIWKLRAHYKNRPIDHEELIKAFNIYVSYNEYIILEKKIYNQSTGLLEKSEKIAVKTIKRGNDKWKKKLKRKLFSLKDPIKQELSKHHSTSNVLFITFTIDPKVFSLEEAWKEINNYFNRGITNLRNKYGQLAYAKVLEAHASGYPHIHALIWLKEKSFEITKWRNKFDRKLTWRVKNKRERKRIKSCWKMGFTDIQVVYGQRGVSSYLEKMFTYISKDTIKVFDQAKTKLNAKLLDQLMNELAKQEQKIYLGLALSSLFNKHSFGLSQKLLPIARLDSVKNNSNFFNKLLGSENANFLVIWEFIDLVSEKELLSFEKIKVT